MNLEPSYRTSAAMSIPSFLTHLEVSIMATWHPLSASERQVYWNGFQAAVSFLREIRLAGYTDLAQAEQLARKFQADIQPRFEPGTQTFSTWREKIGANASILKHSPKDGPGFDKPTRYPEVFQMVASDLRSQDPVTRRKAENQAAANELAELLGAAPVNMASYSPEATVNTVHASEPEFAKTPGPQVKTTAAQLPTMPDTVKGPNKNAAPTKETFKSFDELKAAFDFGPASG
jgi:hypothetical protein